MATKQRGWCLLFCRNWRSSEAQGKVWPALRLSQCPLWTCGCLALKGMRLLLRHALGSLSQLQEECHLTWPGFLALLPFHCWSKLLYAEQQPIHKLWQKCSQTDSCKAPTLKWGGGFPPAKPPHFSLPCGAPAWWEERNGGLSKGVPTARSLFAQHMGRRRLH